MDDLDLISPGEYREQMMKTRIVQYFFGTSVLNFYCNKCCVTELCKPDCLLRVI